LNKRATHNIMNGVINRNFWKLLIPGVLDKVLKVRVSADGKRFLE